MGHLKHIEVDLHLETLSRVESLDTETAFHIKNISWGNNFALIFFVYGRYLYTGSSRLTISLF